MMTLTPTKSIEPYQVLFEKSPILQLIVRLEKKKQKKQRHVNSFYQFHGEIIMIHRLCSTQFQVELLSIINCLKTLLAFHLKTSISDHLSRFKYSLEGRLPRPP